MSRITTRRGSVVWCALAAALALHVVLVFRQYPVSFFVRGDVPFKGDVFRYFATTHAAEQTGGLYGYDPYFMAGYPTGLWNSMGKKGFEVLHLLLPWVPLARLFYLALVGTAALAPLLMWAVVRRVCADRAEARLLPWVLLVYWHLETQTAYFWGYGNVFFPAAACLAVVAVALACDLGSGRRPVWEGVRLGAVLAAIFYAHTVTLVSLIVPFGLLGALRRADLRRGRTWQAIGAAAAVAAGLAVWWLVPLLRGAGDCVPQPHAWLQGSWKHLVMDAFSDRVYRHHFDRNFLLRAAAVFGAVGTALAWRRSRAMAALGAGGFAALLLAYAGSYSGRVAAVQPYRFLIPAVLFLIAPATAGLVWAARQIMGAARGVRVAALLLLLAAGPTFTGYLLDLTWRPLPCGLTAAQRESLAGLKRLPVRGRVLSDDLMLSHVIPCFCRLPVIGGLSTQAFLKHRFAGMDNHGRFFGRPCSEWKADDLKAYLDAYAVEYAAFSRPDWLAFAEREPGLFEPVETTDYWRVFRVRAAAPSLVLSGEAEASASYAGIGVRSCRSAEVILKLHYAEWLAADAGVRLEPVQVLDDPVPFIRAVVPAGVQSFRIAARGRRRTPPEGS